MLDILLIVVIGGMGTMYGAVIGAVLFVLAQNYLQDLLKLGAGALEGVPVLSQLVSPDRWLLWLGVLFVLSVYHFPTGVVGRLRLGGAASKTHDACTSSNYIALPRPRAALHRVGRRSTRDGDRLARPGAHRARHGRHRRAPGAALPRDLPRHHRPRPEPVEPGARRRNTAWPSMRSWRRRWWTSCGLEQVHWLGTSMGGAIGLKAARRQRCAGASGAWCSTTWARSWPTRPSQRIRSYAGSPPAFATVSELEQYFRTIYKPYGALTDAQWRRLTETSTRRLPDGRVTPHYDPAMVQQFTHHADDYALWDAWDSLDLPVLCLRGEHSDLLLPESGRRHAQPRPARGGGRRSPAAATRRRSNTPEQYALVERFLAA